jgi:catechol 2,3-dioxygenase-like lactoylglutathione lyase family enzyme
MSDKPVPKIGYVFNMTNDIAATREFYVELLGMEEASFMDTPEMGWLALKGTGFQMMWFRADEVLPVLDRFTCQPGWMGGEIEATSWAVEIPEADFAATVGRLTEAGVRFFKPEPDWRQDSYWGVSVMDPMGITLEVFTLPAERPEKTEWGG